MSCSYFPFQKIYLQLWISFEVVFLTSLISKPREVRVARRLSTVFLLSRPRHSLNSLAAVVKEIEEIPAHLPNGAALKDSVQRARDWLQEVEALQVGFQSLTVPLWRAGMERWWRGMRWVSWRVPCVWVGHVTDSLLPRVDALAHPTCCPHQLA